MYEDTIAKATAARTALRTITDALDPGILDVGTIARDLVTLAGMLNVADDAIDNAKRCTPGSSEAEDAIAGAEALIAGVRAYLPTIRTNYRNAVALDRSM